VKLFWKLLGAHRPKSGTNAASHYDCIIILIHLNKFIGQKYELSFVFVGNDLF